MSQQDQPANVPSPGSPSTKARVPQTPASQTPAPPLPPPEPVGFESLATTMLHVSWMAIALGLVMQLAMVGIKATFGKSPTAKGFVEESVQKVSWSLFVCSGLAVGTAASKARGAAMGLAGFLSAPVAFTAARSLQKSAQQALAIPPVTPTFTVSPIVLASIKAIEYACLGVALAYLGKKTLGKPKQFALTGLTIGVFFGGVTLVLLIQAMADAKAINYLNLTSTAVNEIIFPVGCSMVIYAAQTLGSRAGQVAK